MNNKTIRNSTEYEFLTVLEKMKLNTAGWVAMRFAMSRMTRHDYIIENPSEIIGKLEKAKERSNQLVELLTKQTKDMDIGTLYQFEDGDVVFLARVRKSEESDRLKKIFEEISHTFGQELSEYNVMAKDIYNYQKMADKKMLSLKRNEAYKAMADKSKVKSIPLRRKRREEPIILFVEDDKFTTSYASNILNKEYDVVVARNGEEAIYHYIDCAPDIVFMDIHLPGLGGHDALKAIRKVDPEAYVVMLSIDTERQNVVNAGRFGASGFLKKPFTKNRLMFTTQRSPFIKTQQSSSSAIDFLG